MTENPTVLVADDPNRNLLLPLNSSWCLCLIAIWVAARVVVLSVPQSALTMLGHPKGYEKRNCYKLANMDIATLKYFLHTIILQYS